MVPHRSNEDSAPPKQGRYDGQRAHGEQRPASPRCLPSQLLRRKLHPQQGVRKQKRRSRQSKSPQTEGTTHGGLRVQKHHTGQATAQAELRGIVAISACLLRPWLQSSRSPLETHWVAIGNVLLVPKYPLTRDPEQRAGNHRTPKCHALL